MKILRTICRQNGYQTSGSDIALCGHDAKNVEGADTVVYSAAIPQSNPELVRAKELGLNILTRAEMLGRLCNGYGLSVAVSGTHGKTTTTAMLWQILLPQNPTVHIGGNYNGQIGRMGGSNLFITEACEYKRSFLSLNPDIAIILNTDLDHTDCYKDLDDLRQAYREFAGNAKKLVVINGDEGFDCGTGLSDEKLNGGSRAACESGTRGSATDKSGLIYKNEARNNTSNNIPNNNAKKYITVGLNKTNDYCATCIIPDKKGRYSFCVYRQGRRLGRVSLGVAGRHNVYNALFAVAACMSMGVSFGRISAGLNMFTGAERRMEFLGYREGCAVFSDYAHHPREISTSLLSAKESCYRHTTVVFEPHTYTRTRSFLDGFVDALRGADRIILLPIYAAREAPIEGVDSRIIADLLKQNGADALYFDDYQGAEEYLKSNLKDDGILLFMGAGTVDKLARKFLKNSN